MSKQRLEWKEGISHENIRRRRGSLPGGAVTVEHWCMGLRNSLLLPRLCWSGEDRHSRNNPVLPGPCSGLPLTVTQIRESSVVWCLLLPICIGSVLLIIQLQFLGSPLLHRRRIWQPTPVSLPGGSHGQRSLVDCSPWGCRSRARLSD